MATHPISTKPRPLPQNLRFRGTGLLFFALTLVTCHWLGRYAQGGHHSATTLELVLAAFCFVCGSGSGALLLVGPHLLDEVEISARWAAREPAGRP